MVKQRKVNSRKKRKVESGDVESIVEDLSRRDEAEEATNDEADCGSCSSPFDMYTKAMASSIDAVPSITSRTAYAGGKATALNGVKVLTSEKEPTLASCLSSYCDVMASKENDKELVAEAVRHVASHLASICGGRAKQSGGRDRGYSRPSVLVVCPSRAVAIAYFRRVLSQVRRDAALDDAAEGDLSNAAAGAEDDDDLNKLICSQYSRFMTEYTVEPSSDDEKKVSKGEHFCEYFGPEKNTDDDFRMGISFNASFVKGVAKAVKRSLVRDHREDGEDDDSARYPIRLYSPFQSSDLIIASPLSLKLLNERSPDDVNVDLSSISIMHLSGCDYMHNQNWDHVREVVGYVNRKPTKFTAEVEFDKVHDWLINCDYGPDGEPVKGSGFRRQVIMTSKFVNPEIASTFSSISLSPTGSYKSRSLPRSTAVDEVDNGVRQCFVRLKCESFKLAQAEKMRYFKDTILPSLQKSGTSNVLIYTPSYFDFVPLRNILLRADYPHVTISEYSRWSEVQRGRSRFYHSVKPCLLYTGGAHFYNRLNIRGVKKVYFIGVPDYKSFYSEVANFVNPSLFDSPNDSVSPVVTIFTNYEIRQLEGVVGRKNSKRIEKADKDEFMFM